MNKFESLWRSDDSKKEYCEDANSSKLEGDKELTRRKFLKKATIATAALLVPEGSFAQSENKSKKNEKNEEVWKSIEESVQKLKNEFGLQSDELAIIIDPQKQSLYLIRDDEILWSVPISTSKFGLGSKQDSYQTPVGTLRIAEKIGDGAEPGSIFKGREDTGKKAIIRYDKSSGRDYVTSRVMWLDGQEYGKNKGENIDARERYIYIHGTPDEGRIGEPASYGCIRMRNKDVIDLFDIVPEDTLVEVQNKPFSAKINKIASK